MDRKENIEHVENIHHAVDIVLEHPIKGESLWSDAWKRLKKNRMAIAGLVVICIYAFLSIAAPILPIYSYKVQVLNHQYLPPSLFKNAGVLLVEKKQAELLEQSGGEMTDEITNVLKDYRIQLENETDVINKKTVYVNQRHYLLGTDNLGRDLLARIIYGGRVSIAIGLIGTLTAVFIGIVFGATSGFIGGRVDLVMMRVVDIIYSLPYMLVVIIFMALLGRSIFNLFFALAIISWLTVSRVVRGQVISLKNFEFVEAAKSIGASNSRIIFRHLIPNTLGVIIVFATLRVPVFIMTEAFLSFLGLGVQAPFASWGSLVQEGVDGMAIYPWRLFFPAIAMVLFLFSMNFLGDGLRDALDPQSKNRL